MQTIKVNNVTIGNGAGLALIAGPCVIENWELTLEIARQLKVVAGSEDVALVFKASYDKANRTSIYSYRGSGIEQGLQILREVRETFNLPVLTDVHSPEEAEEAAKVVDILQIPAFLCRQTDLLLAAGRTGKVVQVKKGQFMAPWDMQHVIEKIESTGNRQIMLCERGASFGYNNLVSDFRSLVIMRGLGYPVVYDATHSVQLPGGAGTTSGGQRQFVPYLSRAAAAVGIDALFLEVHPQPEKALSDGANSLPLQELPKLIRQVKQIHEFVVT